MSEEFVGVMKELTEFQQQLRNNIKGAESMVMIFERIREVERTLETKLEHWKFQLKELECLTTAYYTKAAEGAHLLSPLFEFLKTDKRATFSDSDSPFSPPRKKLRTETIVSSHAIAAIIDSASATVTKTKCIMNPVEIMSSLNTSKVTENAKGSTFVKSGGMTNSTDPPAELHVLNPLEIPLILENIFSFLGQRDLGSCRQVCSLWETYSRTYWRASSQVQIICGVRRGRRQTRQSNATEFVKFVRKRGMYHRRSLYTNFAVTIFRNVKLFWSLCGPWIKILRLHNCRFATIDDFRKVAYEYCPNMQELDVEEMNGPWDFSYTREPGEWTPPQHGKNAAVQSLTARLQPHDLPISWMELISHFPELKVLNLEGVLTTAEGHGKEVSSTLAIILQQNQTPLKLRHTSEAAYRYFHDHDVIPTEFVTLVEHPNLHLECVCVWMNDPDANTVLRRILTANAATLKKLRLCRNYIGTRLELYDSFNIPGEGTQLVSLQEMEIVCDNFESLSFLRFAPHLTKLTLSHLWGNANGTMGIIERTNMLEMQGVVLTNCTELKIGFEILIEELQKLCTLLPNVTKLSMISVHGAELELIRDYWPNTDVKTRDCP